MYSFNREGKTAGEFRVHLRGSHYGTLQGGTAIRVNCPKENAPEIVHSAHSAGRKITLEGIISNSKRLIYAVFS
jgi:hypothetical protein